MFNKLFGFKSEQLDISVINENSNKSKWSDRYNMLKIRLPYLLEEKLGLNLNYYILKRTPNNLLTPKLRFAIKENELEEVKNYVFTGAVRLDDPVDIYTCHTMVHDAVILDRSDLFNFLVESGANLNLRD